MSIFPVQPWLDIPATGFSVMAVADGPRRAAEIEPAIRQLAWQAWEERRAFTADLLPVDEAIRRALAQAGGALSYGPDWVALARRAGYYAARILKGTSPADLPVERPKQYQLVVNARALQEMGLSVPPTVLLRADKVIE